MIFEMNLKIFVKILHKRFFSKIIEAADNDASVLQDLSFANT